MIVVCADLHIGNFKVLGGTMDAGLNRRGRATLEVFRRAVVQCAAKGVEALFIAGDLFHSRRPEPAIIAGVLKILATEGKDLPVVIIPGNHDMLDVSADQGNTACEPLYQVATIINTPQVLTVGATECVLIPFQGGTRMGDFIAASVEAMADELVTHNPDRVLITHVGVFDDDSPPWCEKAKDGMHANELFGVMERAGARWAFVGNYHQHRKWEKPLADGGLATIIQCGTLCPHGHGDAGQYPDVGALWSYDVEGVEHLASHEVDGPRFTAEVNGEGRDLRVRLPENTQDVPLDIMGAAPMKAAPGLLASAIPEAGDARAALISYMAEMPPVAGINKADVEAFVLDVWAQAGGSDAT